MTRMLSIQPEIRTRSRITDAHFEVGVEPQESSSNEKDHEQAPTFDRLHEINELLATGEPAANKPDPLLQLCDLYGVARLRESKWVFGSRTEIFLKQETSFIPNREFRSADLDQRLLEEHTELFQDFGLWEAQGDFRQDLPAHLARLCEGRLLDPREERHLFCLMNYLKFRANAIRMSLENDGSQDQHVLRAEQYLALSRRIRDMIVGSNMRLVISIVKKFVSPHVSFDELLSEGIETVLNAVEKFDFDRGFRFSTYAYRSIARHAYRIVTERQKEMSRFLTGSEESSFENEAAASSSSLNERAWSNLRALLAEMMDHLDRRERFIIRGRYALGSHRKVRSFQCLADKLGISKERVRQLESRAVKKLQALALKHNPDNMIETLSMV